MRPGERICNIFKGETQVKPGARTSALHQPFQFVDGNLKPRDGHIAVQTSHSKCRDAERSVPHTAGTELRAPSFVPLIIRPHTNGLISSSQLLVRQWALVTATSRVRISRNKTAQVTHPGYRQQPRMPRSWSRALSAPPHCLVEVLE